MLRNCWSLAGSSSISIGFGFIAPFFVLIWRPSKRSRGIVAAICSLIIISRVADKWWLVLPVFAHPGPFWLDVAAILALGGAMVLLFGVGAALRPAVKPRRLADVEGGQSWLR